MKKGKQTDRQAEAARIYAETCSVVATARELGIEYSPCRVLLKRAGVLKPSAEARLEASPGQFVKATSTLVRIQDDPDGRVLQWVKTDTERANKVAALEEAIRRLSKTIAPLPKSKSPKEPAAADLMVAIPMGDPHVGLLAWAAETGADWDLKIAERVLVGAIEQAVQVSPPAARCLLINLGDYFHTDSQANETARSGHQLDVDSRWSKMLEVGIRIQRRMIELCLGRFGEVHVDNVRGNHDDHSSVMLSHVMAAYFSKEPRVKINMTPALHSYHEWGKCYIGTHHGHTAKIDKLPILMAAKNPDAWGRTRFRRIYRGHFHHDSLVEFPGVIVETVNTLAAPDAYAAGAGYLSGRDLKVDVWHKTRGLINRSIIGIEQIERGKRK